LRLGQFDARASKRLAFGAGAVKPGVDAVDHSYAFLLGHPS